MAHRSYAPAPHPASSMADGLATAALLFLLPLALIAAGVAWWVHRPQRNEHETTARIQPLFTSDLVVALDPEENEELIDEEAFDSEMLPVASTKSSSDAADARVSFAPPSAPRAPAAAVRPAMPVRPIAPAPRHAAASRATSHSTSPLNASATSHPQSYPPSYPPSYPQAPATRTIQPAARIAHPVQQTPSRPNLQQAWADGQAVRQGGLPPVHRRSIGSGAYHLRLAHHSRARPRHSCPATDDRPGVPTDQGSASREARGRGVHALVPRCQGLRGGVVLGAMVMVAYRDGDGDGASRLTRRSATPSSCLPGR